MPVTPNQTQPEFPTLRIYLPALLLIAVMCLLTLLGDNAENALRFDRDRITEGQIWRLLTGHFVHLSWVHTLGNSAGLLMANYVCAGRFNHLQTLWFVLFSAAITGGGLYFFAHDLFYYVGLSGILHGLLIVSMFRSQLYTPFVKGIFIIVIAAKVAWEQTPFYDDMAMADLIGGRVETRAHLFGFISAAVWLFISFLISRRRHRD